MIGSETSPATVGVIEAVPRGEGWGRVDFKNIPDIESYRDRWDTIAEFLAAAT